MKPQRSSAVLFGAVTTGSPVMAHTVPEPVKARVKEVVATCVAAGNRPDGAPAGDCRETGGLTLKLGNFVSTDTPCNRVSNATDSLVTGDGIDTSRTVCAFTRVEPQDGGKCRVTQSCGTIGGWGHEEPDEISTVVFEIADDSRFTIRWPGGSATASCY